MNFLSGPKIFFDSAWLYCSGFLVMLGLGFVGWLYFVCGLVLFVLAMIWSLRTRDQATLERLLVLNTVLFLINLAFFSTVEILPWLDVSLAIYLLLVFNLLLLTAKIRISDMDTKWRFPFGKHVAVYLGAILLSGLGAAHFKDVVYFFIVNAGAVAAGYAILNGLSGKTRSLIVLIKSMVLLGVVSALLAVWQLYSFTFKAFFFPYIAGRDRQILELWEVVSRVVGTWQHPSYLGTYLALVMPLAIYLLFWQAKNNRARWFWAAGFVITAAVLLLTNTRSSVLAGVFGALAVFMYGWFSKDQVWRVQSVWKFAVFGLLAAASLILYQFVFVAEIYTKPQAWRVDASATIWGRFLRADSMSTESLVQRSQLYSLAYANFLQHPIVGIGAKNFQYQVEKKFGTGTDAHNIILQTAAEMGFLGLLAAVALYGSIGVGLFKALWNDREGQSLRLSLLVAVLLILFDSQFNNPLFSLRLAAVFWIFIGCFFALTERKGLDE